MANIARQLPSDPAAGERAWLVFRLGTHVLCASVQDVEAIIEKPASIVTLPLAPPYLLGTFLFRDRAATAISLRRKLCVKNGEDTDRGPFIAAQVRDSVVAFWVDEVRDVLDDPGVCWSPMPVELDGGLFDGYAIRDDELILHTRFDTLFDAPAATDAVAQWDAQGERPVAGESQPSQPPIDASPAAQEHAGGAADDGAPAEAELPAAPAAASAPMHRPSRPAIRPPRPRPRAGDAPRPLRSAAPRIETAPRPPEVALPTPEAASGGGSPRIVWPAAALAALAVVLAVLWTLPSPKPAKPVQSGELASSAGRAAPPRQRTPVKPHAAPPATLREYVVARGDTLWAIARRFLGNPQRYPQLVRDSGIRNPDLIHPGDIVRIELRSVGR